MISHFCTQSLKKFAYTCCHRHLLPQNDTMANIIQLFAPNLEDFVCRFFLTQDYSIEISSPLSEVYFDMILKEKEEDENEDTYSELPSEKKIVYAKRVVRYLRAVSMVKNLGLSPFFLEVLSQAPNLLDCQPPRLCDLQYLTLEMWSTRGSLRAIAYLLKMSPNITRIYLCSKTKESNITDIGDDWEAGLSLPGMLSHLKYVQFEEAEGCDAELKLLVFFLKNAKVLEKVVLYFRPSAASSKRVRQEQFKDKLRAVPTASSSIKMVFKIG